MDDKEVEQKMKAVFQEVFDNQTIEIFDSMTSSDVVGWDSFSHINLITALEIDFDIDFNQQEAFGFKAVGELKEAIYKKVNNL